MAVPLPDWKLIYRVCESVNGELKEGYGALWSAEEASESGWLLE